MRARPVTTFFQRKNMLKQAAQVEAEALQLQKGELRASTLFLNVSKRQAARIVQQLERVLAKVENIKAANESGVLTPVEALCNELARLRESIAELKRMDDAVRLQDQILETRIAKLQNDCTPLHEAFCTNLGRECRALKEVLRSTRSSKSYDFDTVNRKYGSIEPKLQHLEQRCLSAFNVVSRVGKIHCTLQRVSDFGTPNNPA